MTDTPPAAWALATDLTTDQVNLHLARLEAAGLLGVVEQDGHATLYLPSRADDLPLQGTWSPVAERDWNAAWKAGLDPVRVGDVAIVAPWHEPPAAAVVLVIEPGQAFGTGHHETTTRCVAALADIELTGRSVLDVGTGTGVLALCAAALGAHPVTAVDTDPLAVDVAAANAASNNLQVDLAAGSVEDVGDRVFDVVVANLTTDTVVELAASLVRRVADDGVLIVSGVSNERIGEARGALERAGVTVDASAGDEWALLRCRQAGTLRRSRPRTRSGVSRSYRSAATDTYGTRRPGRRA